MIVYIMIVLYAILLKSALMFIILLFLNGGRDQVQDYYECYNKLTISLQTAFGSAAGAAGAISNGKIYFSFLNFFV